MQNFKSLMAAIVVAVFLTTSTLAFDPISWTDSEGTFVIDFETNTWSFGSMAGTLSEVTDFGGGAVGFAGSGDASVDGYYFVTSGTVTISSNQGGTVVVSGPVN